MAVGANSPRQVASRWKAIEERLAKLEAACCSTPELQLALRWARIEARMQALGAKLQVDLQQVPGSTTCSRQEAQENLPCVEDEDAGPIQKKLTQELISKGFTHYRFVRVPADYYDQPLEFRQACLAAASIDHLCKTIISENTRAHPSIVHEDPLHPHNWADSRNSRYYTIIVQYTARLHFEKLKTLIHRLNEGKVGRQYFNMRLAPEDVNDALSGYSHNAVSPIGMAVQLPIVMSDRIAKLQPAKFFLGAGEVDLKVELSTQEFIDTYKPIVADITY